MAPYSNQNSARFVLFGNACQDQLGANYPQYDDRYFLFYAYWYTKGVPGPGLYCNDHVVPMVVMDCDHVHPLEAPSNAGIRGILQGWQDISLGPVAVYEWYIPGIPAGGAWDPFPWIAIRKPIMDLRYWRDKGIKWVHYETEHYAHFAPYRWITYYIAARGLWNPDQNPLHLLRELCQDLYGSAWQSMYDYYNLLDLTMVNSSAIPSGAWGLPAPSTIFNTQVRAEADALLAQAQAEAASDPAVVQSRVQDAVDAWQTGWAHQ